MNTLSITYIFLATLFFYATPDVKENLYSWQLTFDSFENCQKFYDQYGDKLLNGLLDHGKKKYGEEMGIDYLACAMVEIDPQKVMEGTEHPNVMHQLPVYERN
ncbi:MAG: hypothetical protein CMC89_05185 [Flavobacteriaceae bacterium]|nr:hypothetical protein [Flavobacteriaceae bacterium]